VKVHGGIKAGLIISIVLAALCIVSALVGLVGMLGSLAAFHGSMEGGTVRVYAVDEEQATFYGITSVTYTFTFRNTASYDVNARIIFYYTDENGDTRSEEQNFSGLKAKESKKSWFGLDPSTCSPQALHAAVYEDGNWWSDAETITLIPDYQKTKALDTQWHTFSLVLVVSGFPAGFGFMVMVTFIIAFASAKNKLRQAITPSCANQQPSATSP